MKRSKYLEFASKQALSVFIYKCTLLRSDSCLVMQWNLSRLKSLIPTIQEFIFLYIRKLFECLYDHLSDLQIEKNDETIDTNNCVRFVSDHCYMTQEWQECYSNVPNVTNLVTSRTHRSNTKRISSFGETMITFQLPIRFEKFIFINFDKDATIFIFQLKNLAV